MAVNLVRHSPEALAHYANVAGLSLSELLQKAQIKKTLDQIQVADQQSKPLFSYIQIKKLANILHVPDFYLVSSELYSFEMPLAVDHRNKLESANNAYEQFSLLSRYRQIREDYLFILEENEQPVQSFTLKLTGQDPKVDAQLVLDFLAPKKIRRSIKDGYSDWRSLVEQHDVIVIEDSKRGVGSEGCALYFDRAPVISIIKTGQPDSRKLFTLIHELVHLGLKSSVIDSHNLISEENQSISEERYCNRVAGYVLVPDDKISDFSTDKNLADYIDSKRKEINVSRDAIAYQLYLVRKIDKQTLNEYFISLNQGNSNNGGRSQPKENTVIPVLGKYYVQQVVSAYWADKISTEQACRILGINKDITNKEDGTIKTKFAILKMVEEKAFKS